MYVRRIFVTDDRSAALVNVASVTGLTPDELAADLGVSRDRWDFSYVTWSASVAEAMAPVVARLTGT